MRLWAALLATMMMAMLMAAPGRTEAHDCTRMEQAKPAAAMPVQHRQQQSGGMTDHGQDCQTCCTAHCLPPLLLGFVSLPARPIQLQSLPSPDDLTTSLHWPPPLRPPRSLSA